MDDEIKLEGLDILRDTLKADYDRCYRSFVEHEDDQFWRRQCVRTFFALVEGICFLLKTLALRFHSKQRTFNRGEEAMLLEESFDVANNGRVMEKKARIPFKNNLKFAFNAFIKAYGLSYEVRWQDNGWRALQDATKVRDRLMHPKKAIDLEVTLNEMALLMESDIWFMTQLHEMGEVHWKKIVLLRKKSQRMKKPGKSRGSEKV